MKKLANKLKELTNKLKELINKAINSIAKPPKHEPREVTPTNIPSAPITKRPIFIGLMILIVFLGGFFLWAAFFPLDSAAVATGRVTVDTSRKTIEHLEGGIVQEIYVREGDVVKKGQKLLLLDETQSKAQLDIVKNQSYTLLAEEARLRAERDNVDKITFPKELLEMGSNPEIKKIIDGQENIFNASRESLKKNIKLLNDKIQQYHAEIKVLESQLKAYDRQIERFEEELTAFRKLEEKKYIERTQVLRLEREKADTEGEREDSNAAISRAKQNINETELKIINLKQKRQEEAVEELRDVQSKLADLRERGISAEHILDRTLIRAPRAGRIVDLKVHTKGAVISPGEAVMDIVPSDDPLIIEARISPLDIDVVHTGLKSKIKLTALKMRHTPTLNGIVQHISADSFEDKRTGEFYYIAHIEIPPKQLSRIKDATLYPGMPVQVMIIIDHRTPLAYFFAPIKDSFNRAFRED